MTDTPDPMPPDGLPQDGLPEDRRNEPANLQWGGRFAGGPSAIMRDINASIGFDRKLWRQDIRGSLAHAAMLAKIGLISGEDERAIGGGLEAIAHEIDSGRFAFDVALEDIHMNIEARLTERIGEAGKRLHTARSRERPGGDGLSPVGARRDRWIVGADFRRDAGSGGSGGGACGGSDAGVYPFADRPAGDVRPSPAGVRGDAGPRPGPSGRLPAAAECLAHWGRRHWPERRFRSTGG